jgi:hypothetical protein
VGKRGGCHVGLGARLRACVCASFRFHPGLSEHAYELPAMAGGNTGGNKPPMPAAKISYYGLT